MIHAVSKPESDHLSKVTIGIVVFDGIIPFHLSVPYEVFEKVLNVDGLLPVTFTDTANSRLFSTPLVG